jgi:EF hand
MRRTLLHIATQGRLGVYCAVALLSVAGVASASAAGTDHTTAELLDLDGNHRISHAEFVHGMAEKAMREMDADKNESLNLNEVASSTKSDPSAPSITCSEADTAGDGQLSREELQEAPREHTGVRALFQKLDENDDGFLSEAELQRFKGVPLIRIEY